MSFRQDIFITSTENDLTFLLLQKYEQETYLENKRNFDGYFKIG